MEGKILFGSHKIVFSVKFANRKTLGIKVYPKGNVEVLSPVDITIKEVEQRVLKRAQWILRQQDYFKQLGQRSPEKRFVSGESHYYLGRQFLLRVEEGKPNSVRYKGRYFEVICTPKSKAKELMKEWYKIGRASCRERV